jgi:hypothetical protein
MSIAKMFSRIKENNYFKKNDSNSTNAVEYLLPIPANKWRSTAWLDDNCYLPPRYGIVTSNTSESSNAMLESARTGPWLNTIDSIWDKVNNGISEKYLGAKANEGIVQKIKTKIDDNWNNCAGCEINLLDESKETYKVKWYNNY